MKWNWKYTLLSLMLTAFCVTGVQGQDEEPLTDEELKKYALVMDFADQEKEKLKEAYNASIQDNELMDGGRRFKEIQGADGDEAKLQEIGATPEEIEAYNQIEEANKERIEAFKEAYTEKIKDNEQLGAGLYNRITKELKSDAELKARYEGILEGIKSERAEGEEEEVEDEGSEGQ